MPIEIAGRLASGMGLGRHFTRLDWARAQFLDKLGIDPFPGTVNLILDTPEALEAWRQVTRSQGIRIVNPGSGPRDCDARCYLATIADRLPAAIVLPEVESYPPDQIEFIAAVSVREFLSVSDGDPIRLLCAAEGPCWAIGQY